MRHCFHSPTGLLALVLTSALGCGSLDDGSERSHVGVPCPRDTEPASCDVIDLVNRERQNRGLSPLAHDPALARAALGHAEEMARTGVLSHDSVDGREFNVRIEEQGYSGFPRAENIAEGYATPAAVVEGWMGSEGHRSNILLSDTTDTGVGLSDGFWVQVFGRR